MTVPPKGFPEPTPLRPAKTAGTTESPAAPAAAAPQTNQPSGQPQPSTNNPPPAGNTGSVPVSPELPQIPDLAAADVFVEVSIGWKVKEPSLVPDFGGIEKIESDIIEEVQSLTRAFGALLEFDPFLAQRDELEDRILEILRKDDGTSEPTKKAKDYPKRIMLFVGIATTFVLATLPMLFHLPVSFAILFSLLGLFLGLAGFRKIKPAHKGVLMMNGERSGWMSGEGNQWAPWPVADFTSFSVERKVTKLEGKSAFEINVGVSEKAGDKLPSDEELQHSLKRPKLFGNVVEITKVLFPKITPKNPEIMKSREEIEVAKARAVKDDMDTIRLAKRIARIRELRQDLTEAQAWDLVLTQEHIFTKQRLEVVTSGGGSVGVLTGAPLPFVGGFGVGQNQQQDQNRGGDSRRRRGRGRGGN